MSGLRFSMTIARSCTFWSLRRSRTLRSRPSIASTPASPPAGESWLMSVLLLLPDGFLGKEPGEDDRGQRECEKPQCLRGVRGNYGYREREDEVQHRRQTAGARGPDLRLFRMRLQKSGFARRVPPVGGGSRRSQGDRDRIQNR